MVLDGIINASGKFYNLSITGVKASPLEQDALLHIVQSTINENITLLRGQPGGLDQAQIEANMPKWVQEALRTYDLSSSIRVEIAEVIPHQPMEASTTPATSVNPRVFADAVNPEKRTSPSSVSPASSKKRPAMAPLKLASVNLKASEDVTTPSKVGEIKKMTDAEIGKKFQKLPYESPESISLVMSTAQAMGKSVNTAIHADNRKYNRYDSIIPFDDKIANTPLSEGSSYYLNASPITLGEDKYVAAQGPLSQFEMLPREERSKIEKENPELKDLLMRTPGNLTEFWTSIVSGGSNKIVTVANPVEPEGFGKTKTKFFDFITSPQPITLSDGSTISLAHVGKPIVAENGEQITARTFLLTSPDGSERTITHYHYENWPDHGAPNIVHFNKLLDAIDNTPTEGPLFVQCSAGIGRSGTVIAAHKLRTEAKKQLAVGTLPDDVSVDPDKLVIDMRKERLGMVQVKEQLITIYRSLADFTSSKGLSTPPSTPLS